MIPQRHVWQLQETPRPLSWVAWRTCAAVQLFFLAAVWKVAAPHPQHTLCQVDQTPSTLCHIRTESGERQSTYRIKGCIGDFVHLERLNRLAMFKLK